MTSAARRFKCSKCKKKFGTPVAYEKHLVELEGKMICPVEYAQRLGE